MPFMATPPTPSKSTAASRLTTSEIIAKRKRNRKSATVLLDPDLKDEIDKLAADIAAEERKGKRLGGSLAENSSVTIQSMREGLATLYENAKAHSATFLFQDIGRHEFVELLKEHRPTEETLKYYEEEGQDRPEFEPDTFVPALLHLSSYEPKITPEEAQDIYTTWSEGDIETLFMAAYIACRERTSIPFSEAGIEQIGSTEPSSTTGSTVALDGSDGTETSTK
jgi:hypothetical protein